MNRLTLLVAGTLSLTLLLTLLYPQYMVSPGAPSTSHTALADDCFACHTPFSGSPADRCSECHTLKEIGIKTTQGDLIQNRDSAVGFHQQLIEANCVACHSEHQGVAPFRPASLFSHNLLKPETAERCSSCHSRPADNLHGEVEERCSECHTTDNWESANFDHREYFRFDRHHEASCETCHAESNYSAYSCYGCHEHSERNVRGEHLEEGIVEYAICVECHRSGDEDEAEWIWRSKRAQQEGWESYSRFGYREHDEEHDD